MNSCTCRYHPTVAELEAMDRPESVEITVKFTASEWARIEAWRERSNAQESMTSFV